MRSDTDAAVHLAHRDEHKRLDIRAENIFQGDAGLGLVRHREAEHTVKKILGAKTGTAPE